MTDDNKWPANLSRDFYPYEADCGMKHVMERVEKCLEMLRESGKKPYLIPSGGLGKAGIWVRLWNSDISGTCSHLFQGYINAWQEMLDDPKFAEITDVVVTAGLSRFFSNF